MNVAVAVAVALDIFGLDRQIDQGLKSLSVCELSILLQSENGRRDFSRSSRTVWEKARIRQVRAYLLVIHSGQSQTKVGELVDLKRSAVGHAVRSVEDLRDDALFDGVIIRLETGLSWQI